MTTNVSIIGSSLRLLGVVAEGQSVSAEQGSQALTAMNQMMERFTEDRIEIGYFAQTSTTDDCPIPAWAEQGIISKLTQRLMGDYPSSSPPQWVLNDSENGWATIARRCLLDRLKPSRMDHLPSGEGHYSGRSRILTDDA